MRLKNEKPQAAEYILGIACAVFFFAVYTMTAAPGVSSTGRPDLALAVKVSSIPAVGGYPAYLILAKLFTLLPLGDIAYRMNLFSALCAALSTMIAFFILRRFVTQNEGALFGAAALGLSSAVWARATVAGVYTFDLMLLTLAFYLALGWRTSGKSRYARLAALVMGMLIANDPLAAVLFLPLALILWSPKIRRDLLLQMGALFGLGLAIYLYVPLVTLGERSADWARMLSPERNAARAGGDFLMEGLKSTGEALERLRMRLLPSVSQFGWAFAFIGFLGFLRTLRRRVLMHAFLLATIISLPIMLFLRRGEAVGLIPIFVFTLWVGVGMDWIFRVIVEFPRQRMAQTTRVIATLLLGGMLISVTVQSYGFYDRSNETLIGRVADDLLESSSDPAILISMDSEEKLLHALWLSQQSKDIGREIIVADMQLITAPWYREKMSLPPVRSDAPEAPGVPASAIEAQKVVELVEVEEDRAILVFAEPEKLESFLTAAIQNGLYPVPRGLAVELLPEPPADKAGEVRSSGVLMDRILSQAADDLQSSAEYPAIRTYSASVANLGLFMENVGLSDEAELRYRQAVEIDSTFAWPRILLARLLAGRGEVEAALESLRESVRMDPDNAVSLLELGRALVATDSLQAAKKALSTSLDLDPNSACGWYTLGSIYMEEDQLSDAMEAFEKAKELDPSSEFVHSCLSYIYLQLGYSDELVSEIRRWLDGSRGDLSIRLSLAKALKLNGDLAQARAEFYSVVANSDDPDLVSEARREIEDLERMTDSDTGVN